MDQSEENSVSVEDHSGSESDSDSSMDTPEDLIALLRHLMSTAVMDPEGPVVKHLEQPTLDCVTQGIKEGKFTKIVVMCGAGISVAAGLPDFRTPGTGLYDNLQKYKLPFPEAVFTLDFFKTNPNPFFTLAKELYPGNFQPTACHYFIHFLAKKGLLLRCFTQNIDTLEREAGVPEDKMIEAHGSFATATCLGCQKDYKPDDIRERIFNDIIPRCACGDLIKPDITFFGESLPRRFFAHYSDLHDCDLLLVMGTSLLVHPFAGLVDRTQMNTPRVLVNMQAAGNTFRFGHEDNYRDVLVTGDCQESIKKFIESLGWKDEFQEFMAAQIAQLAKVRGPTDKVQDTKSEEPVDQKKPELSEPKTEVPVETNHDQKPVQEEKEKNEKEATKIVENISDTTMTKSPEPTAPEKDVA